MDVEEWAAPKGSYSLSDRRVKPDSPPPWRRVRMRSRRPVRILCGIALVAHVPDQAVVGRIEHVVQGDGELHHAEARAEVTAGHGDGADRLRTQFIRQLGKLLFRQAPDV